MLPFSRRFYPYLRLTSPVLLLGFLPRPAQAQDLVPRLWEWRTKRAVKAALSQTSTEAALSRELSLRCAGHRPVWRAAAQTLPPATPAATDPASPTTLPSSTNVATPPPPRGVALYADVSLGFDGQTAVLTDPIPREARIRRRIRVLNISAEYPLAPRTVWRWACRFCRNRHATATVRALRHGAARAWAM